MKSKRLLFLLLLAIGLPWTAKAQETLTVCDGTETNEYLPVYGYYVDTQGTTSEFIIPANTEGMSDMEGGTISKLTFYRSGSPASWGNPTIQLYLGEVEGTTLSSVNGPSNFTVVKTMVWSNQQSTIEVEFDVPYTYGGGNLLIGTYVASTGSYKHTYFFGVSAPSGSGYCHYSSYNASQSFLPKTTFTYEPASSECPNPKTFVASDVTAHSATMTWTMEDETGNYQFNLEYKKTTEETWTRIGLGNTRTYPLTGLEAETEYQVRIQTACDPENIYWKNLNPNLITEVACPAPTNLAVTPESITAHEATVTWNGTSDSYVVMIGQENLAARADFETGDLSQADFTTTSSLPWTVVANTHSGAYCAKSGNGGQHGTTSYLYLEVNLTADMTLTFSAKVSSESDWDKAYFDIDGDTKIDAISGDGNWIDYSYPLTAGTHILSWSYTKDSSGNSNDDCFYVDDIVITAGVASWTEYTTTNQTYPFNNLTPNRSYLVKVKGNCGSEGYSQESAPVSFTTLPSCFAPTGLAMVAGYPTAHGASFTWDYQTGEVFQYALVQGNVTDPSEVNFNTDWYAGDNFPMWNTLSADTDWSFFLRKNCDGDFSDPVYVYFHTLEACPAPTGFAVMPNSITAHTANLTWQGTSNSYQVAYRTTAYVDGVEEGFSANPNGWLFRTGALNADGTATLSGTTSWTRSTNNGVFDTHIYMNMYSTKNYWLITPSMEIQNGDALSLDMAYTAYSGTQAAPVLNCPTHRFAVLISTDDMQHWTILREWNNSGSEYVLDAIPTSGQNSGNIDLSTYAGQTAYIAFFGHSETSDYDNNFHFDNVTIGTPVPAGDMQYASNITEETVTLQGLLAERKYEAWLQGDCGSEGPSTQVGPITFTTDIACPAPTALTHANVKSNQVDLSWTTGGAEDWVLAYKKTDDANFTEVNLGIADVTIEGTTVTYTLTGLDEETAYTVKVRDNCEASIPGDGMSAWTATTSFTTMAACAVENVTVNNIGHYTATVNWDGESNKGFTVKYRTAEQIDGIEEGFNESSLPSDWTRYSGKVNDVIAGTATLSTTSSGWKMVTASGNVFNSNHAKINIYGTSVNYWLVSPTVTLSDNSVLTFDLALTAYASAGTSTSAASGTCTDDRFVVLVYSDNAWHILREWNNEDGSAYVYNAIATAGETISDINISEYYGKTVQFAFYGESTISGNGDNDLHIDNVTIGTPVPAGSWQENDTNESPYIISGLEPGTKYDLKVAPICDETLVSEIQQFTTASPNDKWFITEGNWGTAANWEPAGVPTIEQTVELRANATIESGCVAEAKSISGTGTGDNAKTLTIEDGGQLKHNSSNVRATVKKNIAGYGTGLNAEGNPSGYYLIANPITSNYAPTEENGFLVGNYDLYNWSYDAYDGNEWRNYKDNAFTYLNSATYTSYGYLYANEAGTTLTFNGYIKAANATNYSKSCTVPASGSYDFPGVYLLGNGFVCDAYLAAGSATGNGLPCYKMNEAGDGFTAVAAGEAIDPLEGVFFVASSEEGGFSGDVYVTTTAPQVAVAPGKLDVVVSQGRGVKDNAIIVFGDNQKLGKFSFREGSSKVYIPMEGKDYAVVNAGNVGEMPVSFEAEHNGSYTLSFNSKEVSFSYLHLIDNLTGADVDLLANPSYSFDARTTDYASRFRLVFATGSSATGDNFGFINGMGNLCIFGIDGTATVQVVDVTGRMLSSETFSGSYERKLNVAPGVYMIRLINGNDVKVQKMIVR